MNIQISDTICLNIAEKEYKQKETSLIGDASKSTFC